MAAETRVLCLAGALLVTALAAGCGGSSSGAAGSSSSSATPAAPTGTTGARAGFAAYTTCLAQHGVKLPQGGFRRPGSGTGGPPPTGTTGRRGGFLPAGVSRATFQKAQQACASKRPRGGFGGGFGGGARPSASALTAFRSCLSSHGVKLPSGSRGFGGLDRSDPKVSKALQTCSVLLPRRSAQGGGTTTTPAS